MKIIIYNSLGEVVRQLANRDEQANYYQEEFNASDLLSGVYFYTISAGSVDGKRQFKAVKKMLLLK